MSEGVREEQTVGETLQCSLAEARLIAVAAQRLDRRPRRRARKADILELIQHLGCVQLDTISVVARSHETVLWSRLGPYDPRLVAELHDPDRALTEYWAHAAAIIPIEAFPYFRRTMARLGAGDEWARANPEIIERVFATARERGPVSSKDFERPAGPKAEPWAWWGGKPDRQALDSLWSNGELMVLRRERGFQRVYDLTERVLPSAQTAPLPTEAEQRRYFVSRALTALGVATPTWVADYFRTGGRPHVPPREAAAELERLTDEGLAYRVTIEGFPEGPVWLAAEQLERLADLRSGRGRPTLTTLLSPFDNLVWHRARTVALFGFDYRLESYTPAAKRRYGYYTLPILHRGRLVGRLDPSHDRRTGTLTIKAIHLEPGVRPTERLATAIAGALRDLVGFLGGQRVEVLASEPAGFLPLVGEGLRARAGDVAVSGARP